MVMAADHDVVGRLLHLFTPPSECLAGYGTGRRPPPRPAAGRRPPACRLAADRVWQVVAIAHHQKTQITHAERISLPGTLNSVRPPHRVDPRSGRVFSDGIDPF